MTDTSDPVPHLYERDRSAIRVCTCGRPYDHSCHDPFRTYEVRTTEATP